MSADVSECPLERAQHYRLKKGTRSFKIPEQSVSHSPGPSAEPLASSRPSKRPGSFPALAWVRPDTEILGLLFLFS